MSTQSKTLASPLPDGFWEDPSWLNTHLNQSNTTLTVTRGTLIPFPNAGGLAAEMRKINLEYSDGSSKVVVYKSITKARQTQSSNLGQPRESIFYETFSHQLTKRGVSIPKVLYCYGDMVTGEKEIIMEDLSNCIQSGYFYGPFTPLNWGKDLPALIAPAARGTTEMSRIEWCVSFISTLRKLALLISYRKFVTRAIIL